MTEVEKAYRSSTHLDEAAYGPFVGAEGGEAGVVSWLRTGGSDGSVLKAGMWKCEKSTFPYLFGVDETFVMIEGVLRVELEDGRTWDLGPNETASFVKGTRSTWTVVEPVLHFFIQTDPSGRVGAPHIRRPSV
jgi:uncharacterized cupin superfamily protein